MKNKKIRLGICLAGAVSAGAYTAGVMDYLFETLERWEIEKIKIRKRIEDNKELSDKEKKIPLHDVSIEILSGASAGGMTAAILGYSFCDGTYYNKLNNQPSHFNYNIPENYKDFSFEKSKLYRSWVDMVDDESNKVTTLDRLLDVSDIEKEKVSLLNMKSLLNSSPIDQLAFAAIPQGEIFVFSPPSYVSDSLNILMSVTDIEGIPIDIRFTNINQNNPTKNVLKMHSGFLRYVFETNTHINLNCDFPEDTLTTINKKNLAYAAMATGAFPFGLINRKIVVSNKLFKNFENNLRNNYKMNVSLNLNQQDYNFIAVDGGAINNEPLGTTVRLMTSKIKNYYPDEKAYYILVDPFPNITNAQKTSPKRDISIYTIKDLAFNLVKVFRNQSMFRQEDLLNALEMDEHRFLIYPSKRGFYFLASGLIGGFSGFFKKAFRQHDYQLGRKNCQTFLRYYFGNKISEIEKETNTKFSQEQVDFFSYNLNYKKDASFEDQRFPYIPDILMLSGKDKEISIPLYNGLSIADFNKIKINIENRLRLIIKYSYPDIVKLIKSQNKFCGFLANVGSRFIKRKILKKSNSFITDYLDKLFKPQSIKQEDLLLNYSDIILTHGSEAFKTKGVYAKVAENAQEIEAIIENVTETINIAGKGDYIVQNNTSSKEKYVMSKKSFETRYYIDNPVFIEENLKFYNPKKMNVHALQITPENISKLNLVEFQDLLVSKNSINIESPWRNSMIVKLGDYLILSNDEKEVYRIEEGVFNETYKIE